MIKKLLALTLSAVMICGMNTVANASPQTDKLDSNYDIEIYQGIASYVNEVYINMSETEKTKLIDELYQEKAGITSSTNDQISNNSESEIDQAFENVMKEETYIVSLINGFGQNTTLENWEFNLQYLTNNIKTIRERVPDVNLKYVNSYIKAYEWVKLNESMPAEKTAQATKAADVIATNFSYNDSVSYANKYYSSYNSSYPDWTSAGGDCANFISQCLYAGGRSMVGTPGTASAAENFKNWFSKGTTQSTSNVSSTWRGADAFRNYWQINASTYKKFTSVNSSSYAYGFTGDAVSLLNSNGRAYHTLIIVGYSSPDFTVAAHTSNTNSAKLSSKVTSNGFIIYNMH